MARFHEVHPVLPVRDVKAAVRYYTEQLGFSLEFQDRADDPNYAGVRRDGVTLHLHGQFEADFLAGTAGLAMLRLLVDDPDALFEEYRGKAEFYKRTRAHDPVVSLVDAEQLHVQNTAWGTREFGFYDPDGNNLTFYRDL
jgi:catechol 2,3-dioxygenase-like lactoylglutathione lyase family enzyme